MTKVQINSPYVGSGQITREQFLFHEMRITARLMAEGLTEPEIVERVFQENLYQFPTEKMLKQMARTCMKRLKALGDDTLIQAVASEPFDTAKQICLYAMMKQYRLVWDFMITVIGEKYRLQDSSYGKMDLNTFFMRLQEQDDYVASWSDSTIKKIRQVLNRILVETEYLDSSRADHLNPVWLSPILEEAIKEHRDDRALSAFNHFS